MNEPLVVTAAQYWVVTLDEVKAHCRIDVNDSAQDALLLAMVEAATDWVEWYTGRTFHQKTLCWALNHWPAGDSVELPRATPLISIDSVTLKDSDENETTWSASEYLADTDSVPGRIAVKANYNWPSFTTSSVSPIRIQYKAGIATASPVTEAPAIVKLAVQELVAGYFENRESESMPDRASMDPIAFKYGVGSLLERLRVSYAF